MTKPLYQLMWTDLEGEYLSCNTLDADRVLSEKPELKPFAPYKCELWKPVRAEDGRLTHYTLTKEYTPIVHVKMDNIDETQRVHWFDPRRDYEDINTPHEGYVFRCKDKIEIEIHEVWDSRSNAVGTSRGKIAVLIGKCVGEDLND